MNNRWLVIGLAVSVVINVFVIGAVAGALGNHRAGPPPHRQGPGPGGAPLMRAGDQLPPEQRTAFREALRTQARAARPLLDEARQARMAAADAFAQATFDKAAAAAALAKARERESAAREKLETAVVDFAAGLPAEQRRELAAGLRRPPRMGGPGGPGRRGGFDRPDGPRGESDRGGAERPEAVEP